MSQTLGLSPAEFIVSDEPCLGPPMFGLAEPPQQDPLLLLNRRLFAIEARLHQLEEARFLPRCRRSWRWLRRQVQRGWAATMRLYRKVRT